MGKPHGPRPTPTNILKKRGSWRAKARVDEPQPVDTRKPICPKWLQPYAKEIWKRITPELHAMGLLNRIDGLVLMRYCEHFAEWKRCKDFLHQHGIKYPKKDMQGLLIGFGTFPEVMLERMHSRALLEIEREYGITPAARARIAQPPAKPAHGNAQGNAQGKDRFFQTG